MIGKDNYIGQQIGNYEVMQKLGSGTFSTVYLARNKHVTTHTVAIKFLNVSFAGTPYGDAQQERENFNREANLLVKLKHPHILPILDFGIYSLTVHHI